MVFLYPVGNFVSQCSVGFRCSTSRFVNAQGLPVHDGLFVHFVGFNNGLEDSRFIFLAEHDFVRLVDG